ncbi:MAG: sodium/glutamate symporter [Candidatus Rokuibacteriota bacterium]
MKLEFNLLYTLLVAIVVLFAGRVLVARVAWLERFSVPAPVVGGCLIAIVLAAADGFAGTRVAFDMSLKDPLLLAFFTTVGLAADARMLIKGGPRLFIFLLVATAYIVIQNAIGLVAARAMDLHPVVGLLGGSITLTGGHGTGGAYATRFGETMNLQGSMELTMACATTGLVLGGLLGGPVAEFLIRRHRLSGPTEAAPAEAAPTAAATTEDGVTAASFLNALFVILLCLAGGQLLAHLMEGTGFILPDFLFCLLLGVLVRNLLPLTRRLRLSEASVDLLGSTALSLFLVMALMAMKLLDLVNLAGPLLLILLLQTVAMAVYAVFVTFRVMGRTYDAAIMAAGHVGFAMSSTAAALAIMKAVTGRSGPSPLAFLIVPMVGAFFIDITNALIIQGYLALPFFGF